MAAKFLALFACIALARGALVRREAPAAGSELQEIEKNLKEISTQLTNQFKSIADSKNTKDVEKAIKEGSDSIFQQLNKLSSSFQASLEEANGKAKEVLETSRAQIQRTAEELRKNHPDVEKNAAELKDRLTKAFEGVSKHTEQLAKEISTNVEQTNQKLAPKIKEAYENLVKNAQEVQKKIHEAANKQ